MNHHAKLYITSDFSLTNLPESLRTAGPDVEHLIVDSFGIAEARQLSEQATVRPLVAAKRSFVICTSAITTEAQNALLKLFEEPPTTSEFHLVLTRESILLPTLLSRLERVVAEKVPTSITNTDFQDFLQLSYADRIAVVGDKIKKKDMQWVSAIHAGLETYCATVSVREASRELVFIDTNLRRRGGSKKMLLEALALALPLGSRA